MGVQSIFIIETDYPEWPYFSFHQQQKQSLQNSKVEPQNNPGITVISSREICDSTLLKYLQKRNIPEHIARQFCKEVTFELYGKKHVALGLENDKGGFELRNSYFKGSSSPKEPRLFRGDSMSELSVFEGFFSFYLFRRHRNIERQRSPYCQDFRPINSF